MKKIGLGLVPAIMIGVLCGAFPESSLTCICGSGKMVGSSWSRTKANYNYRSRHGCYPPTYICYRVYPSEIFIGQGGLSAPAAPQYINPLPPIPRGSSSSQPAPQYINPSPQSSTMRWGLGSLPEQSASAQVEPAPAQQMYINPLPPIPTGSSGSQPAPAQQMYINPLPRSEHQ
jgi:hypothetical protein